MIQDASPPPPNYQWGGEGKKTAKRNERETDEREEMPEEGATYNKEEKQK